MSRSLNLAVRLRRLLVHAAVLATLVSSGVVLLAWTHWLAQDKERQTQETQRYYQAKLAELRKDWLREAARLRAEIEFLRIGELESKTRFERLMAFFTAQGENRAFASVLIARADGQPVFALGCEATLLSALERFNTSPQTDIHYGADHCEESGALYALIRSPLWLGREGKGQTVLAAPLDNALLARIVQPGDQAYLMHVEQAVASSAGNDDLREAVLQQRLSARSDDRLRIELPLAAEPEGVRLVVLRDSSPPITAGTAALAALAAGLAISSLLWLALGKALNHHFRRLAWLNEGAQRFAQTFHRDEGWAASLSRANRFDDEIAGLGRVLDRLMGEAELRLKEQETYRQTLALLDEVVVELSPDGRLHHVSSAWAWVIGETTPPTGRYLSEYIDAQDAPVLEGLLRTLACGEKAQAGARLRFLSGKDQERWIEIKLARDAEGALLRGVLRDVTQSYLQERRITHMALHDALTGLPNRVLLEDRLKVALRLAKRNHECVALGFIDLDHFKTINDNLGHKTGDALLVAFAQRLRQSLRSGDTLARWGGDEFVVLLPELPHSQAAREVAEKLLAAVKAPIRLEEGEFNITFSLGFAVYPDDTEEQEALLAHADHAMFHAKARGRNAVQFYADLARKQAGRKEVYIQQRLVAAVREDRLINHYQPLVEAVTSRVVGIEVLARWHEPGLGWVPPASFIPMAENQGLIGELGEQVWRRALAEAKPWIDQGLQLNVNLSKRQLYKPDLLQQLVSCAHAAGIDPARITLEVTESAAAEEADGLHDRLRALRATGFRLAIDDFGTGYSSLSQLHEMPVDELKIDMSFVRRLHLPQGARMIQTIAALADGLGLVAVAEGVENEESAQRLREMGIDILQGWYFARPMPAAEFDTWLSTHLNGSLQGAV